MKEESVDQLAMFADEPDINVLLDEWRRACWTGLDGARVNGLDDIRFARWSGQTDDGKKHSQYRDNGNPAFPFEGASDVRCRLADSVCNELSALLLATFSRADIRGSATEMSDLPISGAATTLLKWVRDNKLQRELLREAELAAQYATQYGWVVLFTGWEQRLGLRKQKFTFEEFAINSQRFEPGSLLAQLPELVSNPESEDQAATIFQGIIPDLELSDAKELVRDLRETGSGSYEQEYVSIGACTEALGRDCLPSRDD
jgi:hypothetical protein